MVAQMAIIVIHRERATDECWEDISRCWGGVRYVALATSRAFGVRRAQLRASSRSGVARQALAAQLQRMRDSGRRARCRPTAFPRTLRQSSEAGGHEQGRAGLRRMALAAAAQSAVGRVRTVGRGRRDADALDECTVGVVTGAARAQRGVVRNRGRRTVVGPRRRPFAGRARRFRSRRRPAAGRW